MYQRWPNKSRNDTAIRPSYYVYLKGPGVKPFQITHPHTPRQRYYHTAELLRVPLVCQTFSNHTHTPGNDTAFHPSIHTAELLRVPQRTWCQTFSNHTHTPGNDTAIRAELRPSYYVNVPQRTWCVKPFSNHTHTPREGH